MELRVARFPPPNAHPITDVHAAIIAPRLIRLLLSLQPSADSSEPAWRIDSRPDRSPSKSVRPATSPSTVPRLSLRHTFPCIAGCQIPCGHGGNKEFVAGGLPEQGRGSQAHVVGRPGDRSGRESWTVCPDEADLMHAVHPSLPVPQRDGIAPPAAARGAQRPSDHLQVSHPHDSQPLQNCLVSICHLHQICSAPLLLNRSFCFLFSVFLSLVSPPSRMFQPPSGTNGERGRLEHGPSRGRR